MTDKLLYSYVKAVFQNIPKEGEKRIATGKEEAER